MSKQHKYVGLIPAAGQGTRLAPYPCPKELYPIGFQPYQKDDESLLRPKVISQYLVEAMADAGAKKLFFVLGKNKQELMYYFGDGTQFGVQTCYLYQEHLHGMPYALDLLHPWLQQELVLFGMPDTLITPQNSFSQMLETHATQQADVTLSLFPTDTPEHFGMVEVSHTGRILQTIDKPKQTNLTYMWGSACWSPTFSHFLHRYLQEHPYTGKEVVLGDVFNAAIEQGLKLQAHTFQHGSYIDIGTSEGIEQALALQRHKSSHSTADFHRAAITNERYKSL